MGAPQLEQAVEQLEKELARAVAALHGNQGCNDLCRDKLPYGHQLTKE